MLRCEIFFLRGDTLCEKVEARQVITNNQQIYSFQGNFSVFLHRYLTVIVFHSKFSEILFLNLQLSYLLPKSGPFTYIMETEMLRLQSLKLLFDFIN